MIECLPTCTGPGNPPRWPPITYAEWQEYWYDANYDPKYRRTWRRYRALARARPEGM